MNNLPIEAVAHLFYGGPNRAGEVEGDRVRLITPADFDLKLLSGPKFVRRSNHLNLEQVQLGDILVALTGPIGATIIATKEHEGAVLGHWCAGIRPMKSDHLVNAQWLRAWVESSRFRSQVNQWTSGGNFLRLPEPALRSFSVPVPTEEDLKRLEILNTSVAKVQQSLSEVANGIHRLRLIEMNLLFCEAL